MTINGYSEPGASVNTAPSSSGTNAVLMIELDGTNAGGSANGLRVVDGTSTIRGLVINRFAASGIELDGPATLVDNRIEGNFIGTDVTGMVDRGNAGNGITVQAALVALGLHTRVGDVPAASRNVISGNGLNGIEIGKGTSSSFATIYNNLIGTNASGSAALGNTVSGVSISVAGVGIVSQGNVISGNGSHGVFADGGGGGVTSSFIGTNATGTTSMGNGGDGISLGTDGSIVTDNLIAYNGDEGIGGPGAGSGLPAEIRGNSIHSNGSLGIDVQGPAAPDITSATSCCGFTTTISGTYTGTADTQYDLEFFRNPICDPSGAGEGQVFLGLHTLTTDSAGNASFSQTFAVPSSGGASITATATEVPDPGPIETSKFSACEFIPGDLDSDGVQDAAELNCGGNPGNAGVRPERIDGAFAGVSDDGDGAVDEPLPPGAANFDCDGDGYTGAAEAGMPLCINGVNDDTDVYATYPGPQADDDSVADDGCPGGAPQAGLFSEAEFSIGLTDQDPCGTNGWPSDFALAGTPDSTNRINIIDLTSFLAPVRRMDKSPGHPDFNSRWDITPGPLFRDFIAINDLTALIAGTSGYPPMLHGTRAFDGPACPWPP